MTTQDTATPPERAQIDQLPGPTLLEFGTSWCSWCQGAQPAISAALEAHPKVRHLKIEDGPGQPLGRSYRVKLWPTLIFLQDGQEVARLVRPPDSAPIANTLSQISPG